jgi:hypothetical protein
MWRFPRAHAATFLFDPEVPLDFLHASTLLAFQEAGARSVPPACRRTIVTIERGGNAQAS